MALVNRKPDHHLRRLKKEPEWSRICNSVFEQYFGTHDPFTFDACEYGRSGLDEAADMFDSSTSLEQNFQTDASSSMTPMDALIAKSATVEAQQPKPAEPVDFWAGKLDALERNAAACETKQQTLSSDLSHLGFPSFGDCASPTALASLPIDESTSSQHQMSRSAAKGKSRHLTIRRLPCGRPLGVVKPRMVGSINSNAATRKYSVSPSEMITSPRYRADLNDVWAERGQTTPGNFASTNPFSANYLRPHHLSRAGQDESATFDCLNVHAPLPNHDYLLPHTSTNFQQAQMHPLTESSVTRSATPTPNSYSNQASCVPSTFLSNQGSTICPEHYPDCFTAKIENLDFEFPGSADSEGWKSLDLTGSTGTTFNSNQFSTYGDSNAMESSVLPSTEIDAIPNSGFGDKCNIDFFPNPLDALFPPAGTYQAATDPSANHHVPSQPQAQPTTPRHCRSYAHLRSPSPPMPATEPRSSKRSASRRSSRYRRARSTTSTPRHAHSGSKGGFVNFTPDDSNKILNGVAPSGSSKTKARREREAADRRRQLSQAAVRAIVEAGGDLGALSRAGLLG